jgi:glutathione S-transferase
MVDAFPAVEKSACLEETMMPSLCAHPFSPYCQKVLIALYESDAPFTFRMLGPDDPAAYVDLEALWPLKRFPVLNEAGRTVIEANLIIEHLILQHPGPTRLLPGDPTAALEVRTMDRFFDNYIMTPMQKIVGDRMRPDSARDPHGVREAKALLDTVYGWLDGVMRRGVWAAGDAFSLADCAAAPSLFYADWVHTIRGSFPAVRAYRRRLLERPSFARVVEAARPFRALFPGGAPDRD